MNYDKHYLDQLTGNKEWYASEYDRHDGWSSSDSDDYLKKQIYKMYKDSLYERKKTGPDRSDGVSIEELKKLLTQTKQATTTQVMPDPGPDPEPEVFEQSNEIGYTMAEILSEL